MSYPWRDEQVLNELYIEKKQSTHAIAEELGCNQSTVLKWLKKLGIKTRGRVEGVREAKPGDPVRFETIKRGYERWDHQVPDHRKKVRVHRLLAVAEYGFDAVVGMDVHHRNGIPWDNRPGNIELLSHAEHARHHRTQENREVA